MKRRVWIDDSQWFDVSLDEKGDADLVVQCRVVWSLGKDRAGSTMMSERVRRAIESAKSWEAD